MVLVFGDNFYFLCWIVSSHCIGLAYVGPIFSSNELAAI